MQLFKELKVFQAYRDTTNSTGSDRGHLFLSNKIAPIESPYGLPLSASTTTLSSSAPANTATSPPLPAAHPSTHLETYSYSENLGAAT